MNKQLLFMISLSAFEINISCGQTFSGLVSPAGLDLSTVTAASSVPSSCPGSVCTGNNVTFSVTGMATPLDIASNQLAQIDLVLNKNCATASEFAAFDVFLFAPDGTCAKIQSSNGNALTTLGAGNVTFTYRNNYTGGGCFLDVFNPLTEDDDMSNGNPYQTGNYGIYGTEDNIANAFNGKDPNGIWTLCFYRRTSTTTGVPCVSGATILFADPRATDYTNSGDDCSTAIEWNCEPICVSSGGKAPSSNIPGYSASGCNPGNGAANFTPTFDMPPSNVNSCSWDLQNNNDVWIKYTADQSGTVCINISGLVDKQQSIVVSDGNADGDNDPCTNLTSGPGRCGRHWIVNSCPTGIPGYANGSDGNQTHCFTAVAGKTYFLVVDGHAGATSTFYITGISGCPVLLPIELVSFTGKHVVNGNELEWNTVTEHNNDYFSIERSYDAIHFGEINRVKGAGNSVFKITYHTVDNAHLDGTVYYRLKQVDKDGKYSYSKIIHLNSVYNEQGLSIYPNPASDKLFVKIPENRSIDEISFNICNSQGQDFSQNLISADNGNEFYMDISILPKGLWYILIRDNNMGTTMNKFIKN